MDLDKLVDAKFLDGSEEESDRGNLPSNGCDAEPLPLECDCVCHTPCDFGIEKDRYNAISLKYSSKIASNEVYEMN